MLKEIEIEEVIGNEKYIFIDLRSQKEYDEDHVFSAINMPILTDEERHVVGKTYKKECKEKAIELGIEYTAYKLKDYYVKVRELNKEGYKVVFYCYKGGMRSSIISNLLASFGKEIYKLQGGYKSYRKFVQNYLQEKSKDYNFVMIHGNTGVGKTHILKSLKEKECQILDLEYLARNKGSAFGEIGYDEKISQKFFETQIVNELLNMDKNKKIFVESESMRIGRVSVPTEIFNRMQVAKHLLVKTSVENRIDIILEDYLVGDLDKLNIKFIKILEKFRKSFGNDKVDEMIEEIKSKKYKNVVKELLINYYDKLYIKSENSYEYKDEINYKNIEEAVQFCYNEY